MTPHTPGPVDLPAAVAVLHSRLTDMQAHEGYLNGGDTADIAEAWFIEIGMPLPEAPENRGDGEDDDEPEDR
ncbi:hypothetical protein ACFW1A_21715 [Kitasatospora sp. NPDC058965]|uniref:hypothetical protein n=1 Tax=Kitasatospora sp. NPDC058965 TaxID=3346682 RepID=UPI0036C995D1